MPGYCILGYEGESVSNRIGFGFLKVFLAVLNAFFPGEV